MDLGEFFKWVIEHIVGLWPQRIVHVWEQGVRLWLGRPTKLLSPGLHAFFPVLGDIRKVDCTWDVLETGWLTHSIGGQTVSFTIGLPYRVTDAQAMLTQIYDEGETVENRVTCIGGTLMDGFQPSEEEDWELVWEVRNRLPTLLTEAAGKELRTWGLEIGEAAIISAVEVNPIRIMND